jgi:pilus assembly protein CpaB
VSPRRRGVILVSLALAAGGLAASHVHGLERDVEARVGPELPVVVTAGNVAAGEVLRRSALRLARVPARYAPPDGLASVDEAAGLRPATALPRGTYVTVSRLRDGRAERSPGALRRGERAVEVGVAGGAALAGAPPGSRVDVLVSSEPGGSAGRTVVALESVELLAVRARAGGPVAGEAPDGAEGAADARATLRVTLRQAAYLTAAENFAREVRLLLRPPGERGRSGPVTVGAGEL